MQKDERFGIVALTTTELSDLISSWKSVKDKKPMAPGDADKLVEILEKISSEFDSKKIPENTEVPLALMAQMISEDPKLVLSAINRINSYIYLPETNNAVDLQVVEKIYATWQQRKAQLEMKGILRVTGAQDEIQITEWENALISMINKGRQNKSASGGQSSYIIPTSVENRALNIINSVNNVNLNEIRTPINYAMLGQIFSRRDALTSELRIQNARLERNFKKIRMNVSMHSDLKNIIMGSSIRIEQIQGKIEEMKKLDPQGFVNNPAFLQLRQELLGLEKDLNESKQPQLEALIKEAEDLEKERKLISDKIIEIQKKLR